MEDKIKLVKLNTKLWHYKLVKFVFRSLVPEPRKMKNLCPYFWMLLASMLIVPFVAPVRIGIYLFHTLFDVIDNWLSKIETGRIDAWIDKLDVFTIYDLYYTDDYGILYEIDAPKRVVNEYSCAQVIKQWAAKHGFDINDKNFKNNIKEYLENLEDDRRKFALEQSAKESEAIAKEREKRRIKREREEKIREHMDSVFSAISIPFQKLKDSMSFTSINQVIRATKRFFGLVITALLVTCTYFIIQSFTLGVLYLIKIWNGEAVLFGIEFIGLLVLAVIIIVGVMWGVATIYNIIVKQYKNGKLSWFLLPFYYLGVGMFFIAKTIVWYPIYFIFVAFLWKFICVSLIFGIIRGLGNGILAFGGIFGEYFGSSYTDYCPGIEWEDETEDEK